MSVSTKHTCMVCQRYRVKKLLRLREPVRPETAVSKWTTPISSHAFDLNIINRMFVARRRTRQVVVTSDKSKLSPFFPPVLVSTVLIAYDEFPIIFDLNQMLPTSALPPFFRRQRKQIHVTSGGSLFLPRPRFSRATTKRFIGHKKSKSCRRRPGRLLNSSSISHWMQWDHTRDS